MSGTFFFSKFDFSCKEDGWSEVWSLGVSLFLSTRHKAGRQLTSVGKFVAITTIPLLLTSCYNYLVYRYFNFNLSFSIYSEEIDTNYVHAI